MMKRSFLANNEHVHIQKSQDSAIYTGKITNVKHFLLAFKFILLGLSFWEKSLFENKDWGTDQVLAQTLNHLSSKSVILLDEKNDIDTVDDLKKSPKLEALLNNL